MLREVRTLIAAPDSVPVITADAADITALTALVPRTTAFITKELASTSTGRGVRQRLPIDPKTYKA